MAQWYESLSNRGKDRLCSEQQPAFCPSAARWRVLNTGALPAAAFTDYLHLKSIKLHLTTTAVGGALALCAASIEQEPFSVFLNRRRTPHSDHAVVGRRSNAAQWVQPGKGSCLCTLSCNSNGFPPSFRKLAHGEGRTEWFLLLLHRCKREYSMFCWKLCVKPSRASRPHCILLQFTEENCKMFFKLKKLQSACVDGSFLALQNFTTKLHLKS